MRFCVFSSDPVRKYLEKGELRPRYWNPQEVFDEVFVLTFAPEDCEPEQVQDLVGDARLEIIPLGDPRALTLPFQCRRAGRLAAEIRPDLIRAHNPWHCGAAAIAAGRASAAPVMVSLHTDFEARRRHEPGLKLQLLRLLERHAIGGADSVLCVSEYLTGYARRTGARAVDVIYNRVYADQFATPRDHCPGGELHILSVGRFDPPKDQECLIRAIRGMPVTLELIGEGVNRARLEVLVHDLGLTERVRFTGSVAHRCIQDYYARADVFAIATHYEGFCIPVLEAMASGLPVVASDAQPLPEVLGGTGILVEATPDGFREAFHSLNADRTGMLEMGLAARRRARMLDGSVMEQREADLYRKLIEEGGRNADSG